MTYLLTTACSRFRRTFLCLCLLLVANVSRASQVEVRAGIDIQTITDLSPTSWSIYGRVKDYSITGFTGNDVTTGMLVACESSYGDIDLYRITSITASNYYSITATLVYDQTGTPRVGRPVLGQQALCNVMDLQGILAPSPEGAKVSLYLYYGIINEALKRIGANITNSYGTWSAVTNLNTTTSNNLWVAFTNLNVSNVKTQESARVLDWRLPGIWISNATQTNNPVTWWQLYTATNAAIVEATNRVAGVGYLLPASTNGWTVSSHTGLVTRANTNGWVVTTHNGLVPTNRTLTINGVTWTMNSNGTFTVAGGGGTNTLQQVTDVGNNTTGDVVIANARIGHGNFGSTIIAIQPESTNGFAGIILVTRPLTYEGESWLELDSSHNSDSGRAYIGTGTKGFQLDTWVPSSNAWFTLFTSVLGLHNFYNHVVTNFNGSLLAGANMTWNGTTKKFDASVSGGTGNVNATNYPSGAGKMVYSSGTNNTGYWGDAPTGGGLTNNAGTAVTLCQTNPAATPSATQAASTLFVQGYSVPLLGTVMAVDTNGQLNLAAGVATKILLDVAVYDDMAGWNLANNRILVKLAGWYEVTSQIAWLNVDGNAFRHHYRVWKGTGYPTNTTVVPSINAGLNATAQTFSTLPPQLIHFPQTNGWIELYGTWLVTSTIDIGGAATNLYYPRTWLYVKRVAL